MAAIANGIDFLVDIMQNKSVESKSGVDRSGMRSSILMAYAAFGFFWFFVWGNVSSLKFSAILTGASCVQCLGFLILTVKVHGSKSVKGISSKMLEMFVLFYSTRLTSTCLKNGYIPQDKTGDYMYQVLDACSLLLVAHLLYCVHKIYAHTYQEEYDRLSLLTLVVPCLVLAWFVHGTFNKNFFFDTCWALSTNLESLVMVPQLWMMACQGGKVDTVTAHFVTAVVVSGVMTYTFWWFNFQSVVKKGTVTAGWAIIVAHGLKLVLCADFMYYYTLAFLDGTSVVLPNRDNELDY